MYEFGFGNHVLFLIRKEGFKKLKRVDLNINLFLGL